MTVPAAADTPGFPLGTYTVDGTSITAQFNTQKSAGGAIYAARYRESGSGTLTISAIDSVKKQITGIFGLVSRTINYDDSGNVISTTINNVTGGEFTAVSYIYANN